MTDVQVSLARKTNAKAVVKLADFDWLNDANSAAKVTKPLFWVHGRRDRVNTFPQVEKWMTHVGSSEKSSKVYTDLRHGVFMDHDGQQVVTDVIEFLSRRLAAAARVAKKRASEARMSKAQ